MNEKPQTKKLGRLPPRPAVFWGALLALLVVPGLEAGEARRLSLDESIRLAFQSSRAASGIRARYETTKSQAEAGIARLETTVNLRGTAPSYSESLVSQFNPISQRFEYYQTKQKTIEGGLSIDRPLASTGGTLSFFGGVVARDQTSGAEGSSGTTRDRYGSAVLELRQPLFSVNRVRIEWEKLNITIDRAEADRRGQLAALVYEVTAAWFGLFQLERERDIAEEQVRQSEESRETANNKFHAGLIPEVEVLQSESDLAASRSDLVAREGAAERAKNSFRHLVGFPDDEPFELEGTVEYKKIPIPDPRRPERMALEHRTEIQSARYAIRIREHERELVHAATGLKLDLDLSYGYSNHDESFRGVIENPGRSRVAALTLSIPLYDGGASRLERLAAEIQVQDAILEEADVKRRIREEVANLLSRIRTAESRIEVLEKSVAVAQKSYDISVERFKSGIITRNDLFLSQQRLTSAKTSALGALIEYRLSMADLRKSTFWDPETDRDTLQSLP